MGIIKKTIFWVVIFFIAALVTVHAAYSARIIDIDNDGRSCTNNGRLRFNFFYSGGEGDMDLDDVTIYADGKAVNGAWYRHVQDIKLLGSEIHSVEKGKRAMFFSDYYEFIEDKIYSMKVRYPNEDGSKSSVELQMSCPGFLFACEIFEINMEKCYNRNGTIYLEFSGEGFGDIGADLEKDFIYVLKGTSKRHEGSLEDMNAEISEVRDNYWLISVPLGYHVSWAYLRGTPYGCDKTLKGDFYNTITYKKCTADTSDSSTETTTTNSKTTTTTNTAKTTTTTTQQDNSASGTISNDSKPSFFKRILSFIVSIFARG